jgi:hypothetical protein
MWPVRTKSPGSRVLAHRLASDFSLQINSTAISKSKSRDLGKKNRTAAQESLSTNVCAPTNHPGKFVEEEWRTRQLATVRAGSSSGSSASGLPWPASRCRSSCSCLHARRSPTPSWLPDAPHPSRPPHE